MNEEGGFFKAFSAWQHTPGGRIQWLAAMANGKIQRRLTRAATVSDSGNGVPRLNPRAHLVQQRLVMAVQAQIAVAMIKKKQRSRASQPVVEDHPSAMNGRYPRAFRSAEQQTVALKPRVAAALAGEAGADLGIVRQWKHAPRLGKGQAAGRGRNAGDGLVQLLDQRGQLGSLRFTLVDLLLLGALAFAQTRENGAALVPFAFQRCLALDQGGAITLQRGLLLGDAGTGLADLFDGLGVAVD